MNRPNAEMIECLLELRRQLEVAAHGESGKLIDDFSALYGRSKQTVWRWLNVFAGYKTDRKKRSDAGKTSLDETTLLFIATTKDQSVRANGKVTKPTCVAMNIADANGMEVNVSASTINRVLRERRLNSKAQAEARNHIHMRSPYPNYLHQIDPSLCLIYYMGNKQLIMSEAEFNKNKPFAIEKVKLKVWRYVRYDHASATLDVRYYEAAGENQNSLFEFLLWTWGKQEQRLSHGIPERLLWDKGSANTSTAIVRLLDALGVKHETHGTHHAWAKGGVENGNHIVETHFESRLRDEPVTSLEALNASAELWVRDYNANAIKHVDSRVRRDDGKAHVRDDLWNKILRHQGALVAMPDRAACSWFLTGRDSTRRIRDNQVRFVHPELKVSRAYDLSQWAEFYSQKDKVNVTPVLLADGAIRVEFERLGQEPLIVQVLPITEFDEYGNAMSNQDTRAGYSRAPLTLAEDAARKLAETAYGEGVNRDDAEELKRKNTRPFQHLNEGNGIVAHSHLGQGELPQRLLPEARELDGMQNKPVELVRRNTVQMAKWLQGRMKSEYQPALLAELTKQFPDGATEPELEQVLADLRAGRTVSGKARLQAV